MWSSLRCSRKPLCGLIWDGLTHRGKVTLPRGIRGAHSIQLGSAVIVFAAPPDVRSQTHSPFLGLFESITLPGIQSIANIGGAEMTTALRLLGPMDCHRDWRDDVMCLDNAMRKGLVLNRLGLLKTCIIPEKSWTACFCLYFGRLTSCKLSSVCVTRPRSH